MGFWTRARAWIAASVAVCAVGCGGAVEAPEAASLEAGVAIPTATATATPTVAHTGVASRSPRAAEASLFDAMPAECKGGRVFVQLETLFGEGGGVALDALTDKVYQSMPSERGARIREAMKEVGLAPSSIRELAVCLGATRPTFALRVSSRSLRTDLADALIHVFEATDVKPTRELSASGTILVTPGTAIAVVGDVVTIATKKEELDDALMVGGGARPFDEARAYAAWLRTPDVSGGLTVTRGTVKLDLTMSPPSSYRDDWKKDPAIALDRMRSEIDRLKGAVASSPFKSAGPILENVTIERANDEVRMTSAFPSAVLLDTFDALQQGGLTEIFKILR